MEGADILRFSIGALSSATRSLHHPRSAGLGGGFTVLAASVMQGGSTNSSLRLLTGTESGGTFTATGTLDSAAIGGTAAPFAANVRKTWTLSTYYVAASECLALVEGGVAACNAAAFVDVLIKEGK